MKDYLYLQLPAVESRFGLIAKIDSRVNVKRHKKSPDVYLTAY